MSRVAVHSGKAASVFPAGTAIQVFNAAHVDERRRSGTPPGSTPVVTTVTSAADGSHPVTLPTGQYAYYAQVGGVHRYVPFGIV